MALLYTAKEQHVELSILEQVVAVNNSQSSYFLNIWEQKLGGFRGKTIAILGISFKPNTDDLREAPALSIIQQLQHKKVNLRVHDPIAKLPEALRSDTTQQFETLAITLQQCDAVILCSEWKAYREADWQQLKSLMKDYYIFDGRNTLVGKEMTKLGYAYYGIGNR
jgi:UDPglucose 6-dehydrogenase